MAYGHDTTRQRRSESVLAETKRLEPACLMLVIGVSQQRLRHGVID